MRVGAYGDLWRRGGAAGQYVPVAGLVLTIETAFPCVVAYTVLTAGSAASPDSKHPNTAPPAGLDGTRSSLGVARGGVDHRNIVVGLIGDIKRLGLRVEGRPPRVGTGTGLRRVEGGARGQVAPVAHVGVDHEDRVVLLVGDIDAVQRHVHHEPQGVQVLRMSR